MARTRCRSVTLAIRWSLALAMFAGTLGIGLPDSGMSHALAITPAERAGEIISGAVLDESGKPVAAAKVRLTGGLESEETTSDAEGKYQFQLKPLKRRYGLLQAVSADGQRQAIANPYDLKSGAPVDLKLEPVRQVRVLVRDGAGEPIAEAEVAGMISMVAAFTAKTNDAGIATLEIPRNAVVEQVLALKSGAGFDYISTLTAPQSSERTRLPDEVTLTLHDAQRVTIRAVDSAGQPVAGIRIYPWYVQWEGRHEIVNFSGHSPSVMRTTDNEGKVTFDWLPPKHNDGLVFFLKSDDYAVAERAVLDPQKPVTELTLPLLKRTKLSGRVAHPDGKPAAGMLVQASGTGSATDGEFERTLTAADGTYELLVQSEMAYVLWVEDEKWAADTRSGIVLREDKPVGGLDFTLKPATTVRGRVTVGKDAKPVAEARVQLVMRLSEIPAELKKPDDKFYREMAQYHSAQADSDGHFAFHVGPGTFQLSGPAQSGTKELTITDQAEVSHDFHLERPETMPLAGLVTDADGKPVAGAKVSCVYMASFGRREPEAITGADGKFEVERSTVKSVFYARTQDGSQAGIARIGEEDPTVSIKVGPLASATGRLLGVDGKPMPGASVICGIRVYMGEPGASPSRWCFGPTVTTDGDAVFQLPGLLPGEDYEVHYYHQAAGIYSPLAEFTLSPGQQSILGAIRLPAPPKPYVPPTLAERTNTLFGKRDQLAKRLERAKIDAQRGYARVLILLADENTSAGEKLTELRSDAWNAPLDDYAQLAVSTSDAAATEELKQLFGDDVAILRSPALVVLDDQGKLLGTLQLDADAEKLAEQATVGAEFLKSHALPQRDAKELLTAAFDQARQQNKRVFIQQTAIWCGPCKRLTEYLYQNKPVFDENFVYVKIDDRDKHAPEIMKALRKGRSGGIPWSVILDAEGNELGALVSKKGENIGFPSDPKSADFFIELMEKTAPRISREQLDTMRAGLAKP